MTTGLIKSWQDVQNEVLRRIHSRIWKPGDVIPTEAALAKEFGCARVTVNRGLRSLADSGLLDRRRKAGTRIAVHPVRKATLSIQILQQEIEQAGYAYGYTLILRENTAPPNYIADRMGVSPDMTLLHIEALHSADLKPYVIEDRWINLSEAPLAEQADFSVQSPNKWLVENIPFIDGDIAFTAKNAEQHEAKILGCAVADALFVIERRTRSENATVTHARLVFAPDYRLNTKI